MCDGWNRVGVELLVDMVETEAVYHPKQDHILRDKMWVR